MLSIDKLKQNHTRYLNFCEIDEIDKMDRMSFEDYFKCYWSYLEDEGGY